MLLNYDKSEFEGVSALKESDDDIAIWGKQYPLNHLLTLVILRPMMNSKRN